MAGFYSQVSLFNQRGQRKYLNAAERKAFYTCTAELPLERELFCLLFYHTGARIGEIFELTDQHIDFVEKLVTLRTLKKRRKDVFRQIPLPDYLLGSLLALIDVKRKHGEINLVRRSLWSFSRRTASRVVKRVMDRACIEETRNTAMALRHAFAVHAVTRVPLTQVRKWMGHGSLTTTAIYLDVSGIEERRWAEKMWQEEESSA